MAVLVPELGRPVVTCGVVLSLLGAEVILATGEGGWLIRHTDRFTCDA